MLYSLLKSLLFQLEPERAHRLALGALQYVPACCYPRVPSRPLRAMGLDFAHPLGLAAGLDKDAAYLPGLSKVGFAFIEVGTITPRPQPGNPKPRLFRLPSAEAIINRMGFNNAGVEQLLSNLKHRPASGILGINIGKNKDTPLDQAAFDYLHCLTRVYPVADYVTINISSPNTPDLRQLQQGDYLRDLLRQLTECQARLADQWQRQVPLVVKVSPDESADALRQMADSCLAAGVAGMIATNTTCAREAVAALPYGQEMGGLSGKPLFDPSTAALRILRAHVGEAMTLIGVGGIDSPETAQAKLAAGADLLQIYTGLIYNGPGLIRRIVQNMVQQPA